MKITIIIPTYTNFEGFSKLITQLKQFSLPIVVIDNQPNNEKKKLCASDAIVYLPQKENIGFARAINLGVENAKTEWVLFLNDDVSCPNKKTFEKLVEFAEKHNYTAVSPVLKNNRGNIENLGYRVLPIGRAKLNFDRNKIDQKDLDGLTAACLLIRKKDFEKVGMFDERFFAYLEDVDLFLRMKKQGLKFGVDTDLEVLHNKNTTSSKMGNFKEKQDLKNWFLVIWKNWDRKTLLKYLPFIILERLRNLSGYIKATYENWI